MLRVSYNSHQCVEETVFSQWTLRFYLVLYLSKSPSVIGV